MGDEKNEAIAWWTPDGTECRIAPTDDGAWEVRLERDGHVVRASHTMTVDRAFDIAARWKRREPPRT